MVDGSIPLHRRLITAPLAARIRQALPRMSVTEREALQAGGVWWDRELFSGRPDWSVLRSLPPPQLSETERAFLDGPVEELCGMLDDWRIGNEFRDLPPQVWAFLRARRFFGMIIPPSYGGLGFSADAHSAVVMKLSTRSLAAAVTVMVPNALGPAELLVRYGTEAQKDHYLPRLARGEELPCFALTGPEAGSDAAAVPDTGVVCSIEINGEPLIGMRLDWDKRYITLAPVATVMGLAFRLRDPERLLGGAEELGITLALIPTDAPGVEIGRRHWPARQAFQNGPTRGRDVFVPLDRIIGGPAMVGAGWRMLMECLAAGRGISLPAVGAGGAKVCARLTGAYARVRRQFGLPIGRFEGVQEALARIAGNAYVLEAARRVTAGAIDAGEAPAVATAIVKHHATARLRETVTDAMDVHGGKAICDGPGNPLINSYYALPIAITVEGANILTRSMIIFGQGAMRCHPHLLDEMRLAEAARDDPAALADLERVLLAHFRRLVGSAGRALWHNLTGGRFTGAPDAGPATIYYREVERLSVAFALLAEAVLLTLGGGLKRREMISGRLGDVLSELYLASCTLKRFEDDGRPAADLPLLRWTCERALATAEARIAEVLANLPARPVAWLLRPLLLPFGRTRHPPSDRLAQQCAELLLTPSDARDRLTAGIHTGGADVYSGLLERALQAAVAAEAVEDKLKPIVGRDALRRRDEAALRDAVERGAATEGDLRRLQEYDRLRSQVIAVDDFDPDELTRGEPAWRAEPAVRSIS